MTRIVLSAVAGVTALITLAASANAQTTPTTVSYSYSGLPLYIAPDNANIITVANIFVPVAVVMSKVTARVQIQYPNSGDLQIYLYSPSGTRTILLQNDCSVANVDTTFDDAAPSTWKSFCPVEAGRGPFQSDQPLSNFNKDDSSFGTWYLAVQNTQSNSRTGFITNLTLNITGTLVNGPVIRTATLVNAASLGSPGVVAPGEMISIFGLGVGPTIPVSASIGALPTTLGGTTVTFDGTAAPIAYASLYRVDVQVPFTLTPGGTTNVQLTSNSVNSPTVAIPVQATAPGLWTNSVVGSGQSQVANQNGTINSKLVPAPKGSVVSLYASGLGQVTPALTAGAVPPLSTLSHTTTEIGAFIGGQPATVQFAGPAPGYPGLYQINVLIPAGVITGTNTLQIYANGVPSQSGATIEIQ